MTCGSSFHSLPLASMVFFSVFSLFLFLIRTFVIGFRAHLDKPWRSQLKILNLIISVKTTFQSKGLFSFQSLGHKHVFWVDTIQSTACTHEASTALRQVSSSVPASVAHREDVNSECPIDLAWEEFTEWNRLRYVTALQCEMPFEYNKNGNH